jgi:beta-lactamase regulating signal transducer with metallopeptidase domain
MNITDFVTSLLRCSAEAAILALLVFVLQKLFHRRLAPSWRCALWLVVAARLLAPVSFSTAVSLYNLAPGGVSDNTPPAAANEHTNPVPALTGITFPLPPPHDPTAVTSPASPATTSLAIDNGLPLLPSSPATAALPDDRIRNPDTYTLKNTASRLDRWAAWIFAIWLTGVAAMCAGVWNDSHALIRRFRLARPVTAPDVLSLLDDCRLLLRIRSRITIHECDRVNSPVLHGFLRPRLLLPSGFILRFSSDELRYVFLHELAHVKRRDLPVNWLLALLQTIHWFNPLVWFTFSRWRSEREMACDSLAIHAAGNGHNRAYGQAILRILENFVPQTLSPGLVGILENKRQLRQRIAMIAAWAPRRRVSILAISLLAGLALVGLTDAHVPEFPASSSAQTAPDGTVRRITLTILDAGTGLPIKDARIITGQTTGIGRETLTTDEHGQALSIISLKRSPAFPLPDIASHFFYYVSHPDYAGRYAAWNSGGRIQDARLAPPDSWTIRLSRGVPIGGVVRDARGAPIAGTRISISGFSSISDPVMENGLSNYRESSGIGDPLRLDASLDPTVVTDKSGRWSMAHVPSDISNIRVSVRHPSGAPFFFASAPEFPGRLPGGTLARDDLIAQRAVITLPDGITLRGLVTDRNGNPLDGAKLQILYASGSEDEIHDFTSGADGRFTLTGWQPAPLFISAMREGFAGTSVAVTPEPDAQDAVPEIHITMQPAKTLRLASGTPVTLRVLDDESGHPLDEFEVWTTRLHARKTWPATCQFGTKGEFRTTLPLAIQPHISDPGIIFELRAPGYKEWTSARISAGSPAQEIEVRMKRRSADTEAAATPPPARPLALTDEQRHHLNALAGSIRDLLATGDIETFLRAATPVENDWAYLKPERNEHPNPELLQQEIRDSTQTFLALARRMGTWPSDPADIRIRNISSSSAGKIRYGIRGGEGFPVCSDVRLVLSVAPSPADNTRGSRIPGGDYTIGLDGVFVFPVAARLQDGLRWNSLPAGVGDFALRREISLARSITTSTWDPRPLSVADDETLADFAEIFADLLRHRDIARWEHAALQDSGKHRETLRRFQRGSPEYVNRACPWERLAAGATAAMRDVLSRFEKLGIDPQQSTIRVRQVTALTPNLNNLGSLDGLMANLMRITFTVTTPRATPSGHSLAGDYVLALEHPVRYGGQWHLLDTIARWMAFPDGVLTSQEAALMRLDDHVADHGVLPAGMTVPDCKLFPLASGKAETRLSAWRGKFIFIEWWNSISERSMERLDGLQQMMEQHPEWSDDVAIISINVDDNPSDARSQIDARRWTRIENLWAGSGDYFKRDAIRQFHLQSYPNPYWIDRDGIILAAGGSLAEDTPGLVENLITTQLQLQKKAQK